VGQPLVLATLRSLIPGQRRAAAIDWRRAEEALVREQRRLRELARSGRPLRRRRRWRWVRWLARTPEVLLILLAVVVILSALLRGSRGPG